jgi:hypothetical protein
MLSIENLVSLLNIIKTPDEILQIIELFINDININTYDELAMILKCVNHKLRVFILEIIHKNNKLPIKKINEYEEQLLDLSEEKQPQTEQNNTLYLDIFEQLLNDKILICSNVVELAIFSSKCPKLTFKFLNLVKGNAEIEDSYKKFILGGANMIIKEQIKEFGEDFMAEKLSKIFWSVDWYEKCCRSLNISENSYKKCICTIKKENLNLEMLGVKCNLHDYPINENRISKCLIDNNLYNLSFSRIDDTHIKVTVTKQTVFNCEEQQIFSRKLHITRGLKLNLEDIEDKTQNRTYHLK